jgi:hypothetical protein
VRCGLVLRSTPVVPVREEGGPGPRDSMGEQLRRLLEYVTSTSYADDDDDDDDDDPARIREFRNASRPDD